MSFEKAYNKTIAHEGGYAFVKGDKGGETYMGIARNMHPYWLGWTIVDDVKNSKGGRLPRNYFIKSMRLDVLVREFYFSKFWKRAWLDKVNDEALQEIIFDFYVNSGSTAIRKVQSVLVYEFSKKIRIDGGMGPKTIEAINQCNAEKLFNAIKKTREIFYKKLAEQPDNRQFLKGWLRRLASFDYKKVVGISAIAGIILIVGFFVVKKMIENNQSKAQIVNVQ